MEENGLIDEENHSSMLPERSTGAGSVPAHATQFRVEAFDGALEVEQRVDALDGFEGNGRDRRRVSTAPGIGGVVGQFEESEV